MDCRLKKNDINKSKLNILKLIDWRRWYNREIYDTLSHLSNRKRESIVIMQAQGVMQINKHMGLTRPVNPVSSAPACAWCRRNGICELENFDRIWRTVMRMVGRTDLFGECGFFFSLFSKFLFLYRGWMMFNKFWIIFPVCLFVFFAYLSKRTEIRLNIAYYAFCIAFYLCQLEELI